MKPASTPCPSCNKPKETRFYLCGGCWSMLPGPTRRALNQRGGQAWSRLRTLHQEIAKGTPLHTIRISV